MEFKKFWELIRRHRYALIAIPIAVMVITFFLVRKLPDVYASQSRLSAGLTAGTVQAAQQLLGTSDYAEARVNQTFSNVTQTMQLKIVYDQVSYLLMLHDLTSDKPFRQPSKLLTELNSNARTHAEEVYTRLYNNRQALYLPDPDQNGLNEVIKSMKYDYESLKEKVHINRVENSDFIDVRYESDNPLLSEFVVNNLCKEFITYYSSLTVQNRQKSVDFLYAEMIAKKNLLDAKNDSLKNFKIQHSVINLTDQTKSLYAQISDFETRLQLAQKEVEANSGAIDDINSRLSSHAQDYMENTLSPVNKSIVAIQERIAKLNDEYARIPSDTVLRFTIDSLRFALAQRVNQSSDKYIVTPLSTKESLLTQRLKLQTDLQLAKSSIKSYQDAISRLSGKLQSLAPDEATIQSLETDITAMTKDYNDLLNRYNQSAIQLSSSLPIKVIEPALPGSKQPSKKLILVAFGGVISFVIYLLILFIIYYLDDSVHTPAELAYKTDMSVLGALPVVKTPLMDIQKLWNVEPANIIGYKLKKLIGPTKANVQKAAANTDLDASDAEFKKLVRSARYEINMAMRGGRSVVVTSLCAQDGKTLVGMNIVYAFQLMNKKTLLIDGNFLNPTITSMMQPRFFVEDYITGETTIDEMIANGNVTVLGNRGTDNSLFEINSEYSITQKILELKDIYDIIIIEAPGLDSLNQAKEWISVADRVIGIFEANSSISPEMKESIGYLKGMEGRFIGWILNKVTV